MVETIAAFFPSSSSFYKQVIVAIPHMIPILGRRLFSPTSGVRCEPSLLPPFIHSLPWLARPVSPFFSSSQPARWLSRVSSLPCKLRYFHSANPRENPFRRLQLCLAVAILYPNDGEETVEPRSGDAESSLAANIDHGFNENDDSESTSLTLSF